jgi:hypothetical protein
MAELLVPRASEVDGADPPQEASNGSDITRTRAQVRFMFGSSVISWATCASLSDE